MEKLTSGVTKATCRWRGGIGESGFHLGVLGCPCPDTVRSPENEDSKAETGLKSQEDGDSVAAKNE